MSHMQYLEEEDKSLCLVTLSDGEHGRCGRHSIQGTFPTTLKCHLKMYLTNRKTFLKLKLKPKCFTL